MTPDEVHDVALRKPPWRKRGYAMDPVDELLDRIEQTLRGDAQITVDELRGLTLAAPPGRKRGYASDEVDAFLARVVAEWPGA